MQGRHHIKALWHEIHMRGFSHGHVQEVHALKPQLARQFLRCIDQGRAGFNTVNAALALGLEVQVVQDKT
ncbi:hypothetical protein D3C72_2537640 [compost metagenome]